MLVGLEAKGDEGGPIIRMGTWPRTHSDVVHEAQYRDNEAGMTHWGLRNPAQAWYTGLAR